jgi:NMD protein affecting ribosome stability and mRNA decay
MQPEEDFGSEKCEPERNPLHHTSDTAVNAMGAYPVSMSDCATCNRKSANAISAIVQLLQIDTFDLQTNLL